MKNLKTSLILAATLIVGIGFTNIVSADTQVPSNFKVAVVNVPAVVESSSEVMALKKEQQLKLEELQKWLQTVKADVDKQSTESGKEKLAKKYDADLVKKQQALQKDYADKLASIDKKITGVIQKESKAKGYALVLSKNAVLFGGTDITSEITKAVK